MTKYLEKFRARPGARGNRQRVNTDRKRESSPRPQTVAPAPVESECREDPGNGEAGYLKYCQADRNAVRHFAIAAVHLVGHRSAMRENDRCADQSQCRNGEHRPVPGRDHRPQTNHVLHGLNIADSVFESFIPHQAYPRGVSEGKIREPRWCSGNPEHPKGGGSTRRHHCCGPRISRRPLF